jgi:hypothetical protein
MTCLYCCRGVCGWGKLGLVGHLHLICHTILPPLRSRDSNTILDSSVRPSLLSSPSFPRRRHSIPSPLITRLLLIPFVSLRGFRDKGRRRWVPTLASTAWRRCAGTSTAASTTPSSQSTSSSPSGPDSSTSSRYGSRKRAPDPLSCCAFTFLFR